MSVSKMLVNRNLWAVSSLTLAILVALVGMIWSPGAIVAADGAQRVVVVRDTTQKANCMRRVNGGAAFPCPAGSVLEEIRITKVEALANGEPFVMIGDDPQQYRADVDRLVAQKIAQIANSHSGSGASTLATLGVCGALNTLNDTFVPGFGAPISHSVDFYILQPTCIAAQFEEARVDYNGGFGGSYLEKHEYAGKVWNRGCADIPPVPTYLEAYAANINSNFVTTVRSNCTPFFTSAYGLIPIQ